MGAAVAGAGRNESPAPGPLDWLELVRSGLARAEGELDPMWQKALASSAEADIAIRVISVYEDLAYVGDLTLDGDICTCLLRRVRVKAGSQGQWDITGADPKLEFAVTTADNPWLLVRRILPPLEALRAAPAAPGPGPSESYPLTADLAAGVREALDSGSVATPGAALLSVPGLPPEVRAALQPSASVSMLTLVKPRGAPEASLGVAVVMWTVGLAGLHRFQPGDPGPGITRVQPGDLGYHVIWTALGALDTVRRARETFATPGAGSR